MGRKMQDQNNEKKEKVWKFDGRLSPILDGPDESTERSHTINGVTTKRA